MQLNSKVIILLSTIWLIGAFLLIALTHQFIMKSFLELEQKEILNNTYRAEQAIQLNLKSLKTVTADWAHWNEAYDYVEGKDKDWAENNITLEALDNVDVNVMVAFNKEGNPLTQMSVDTERNTVAPLPPGLDKFIQPGTPLSQHNELHNDFSGLISIPSGIMLVAASAISYIDLSKTPIGTLFTARYISPKLIQQLEEATSLDLAIFNLTEIEKNAKLKNVFNTISESPQSVLISTLDQRTILGYALLKDINGKAIGLVRVTNQRDIYMTGLLTVKYFIIFYIGVGLVIAFIILFLIRITIIKRIEQLSEDMKHIGQQKDYSHQVVVAGNDEITSLSKKFNEMMSTIHASHLQLQEQIKQLSESEQSLAQRNKQLNFEINEKKLAEKQAEELNKKLMIAEHEAGVTEVANVILNRVAKTLADVNKTIENLKAIFTPAQLKQLHHLVDTIQKNKLALHELFARESSKSISIELFYLLESMREQCDFNQEELKKLRDMIKQLEEVATAQQAISKTTEHVEAFKLTEVVNAAIKICEVDTQNDITFSKEYSSEPILKTNKNKIGKIIVHLIQNAMEAVRQKPNLPHTISIKVEQQAASMVAVRVIDNGIGIAKENLVKIFTQGFTTKPSRYGIGLHTSAIDVKAFGGNLTVESEGIGKGACFILTLPVFEHETTSTSST